MSLLLLNTCKNKCGRMYLNNWVAINKKLCRNLYRVYQNAAITANCNMCALIGKKIMQKGGSVADAAIATLLCGGIRNPERMGLGGGFVLTLYERQKRRARVLVARERAPKAATRDMYGSCTNRRSSQFGGLAVAVPGSLAGYWELHKNYGRLPWAELVDPVIQMCQRGIYVEPFTRYGLKLMEESIQKSSTLRQLLVDPFTGKVKTGRYKIFRPRLHETLILFSKEGSSALYNGPLSTKFAKDIQNEGGIITASDLEEYRVRWLEPISIRLPGNITAHSAPLPASGAVLLCILNILSERVSSSKDALYCWHYIIEAWKFAYGFRSRLGDPEYVSNINSLVDDMLAASTVEKLRKKIDSSKNHTWQDHRYYGGHFLMPSDSGTAHFNFVSSNGDAVAVTESINTLFGSMCFSLTTGIILNNTMDDFCIPGGHNTFFLPPSEANFIAPGKIPLTSMAPTIVTDDLSGDVRLVIGAAGGTKITSAISIIMMHHLFLGKHIDEAVDMPRLHHQLMPMELEYELEFPEELLHRLWVFGHHLKRMQRMAVVSVIAQQDGKLHAKCDTRRVCASAGF